MTPGRPIVAAAGIGADWPVHVLFIGEERVRVLMRHQPGEVVVADLLLGHGKLATVCRAQMVAEAWSVRWSPTADRMSIVRVPTQPAAQRPAGTSTPYELVLYSIADCSPMAQLSEWHYDVAWEPRFLADGRLTVTERGPGNQRILHLYDHDGRPLRSFTLPDARQLVVGGLIGAERLIVSRGDDPSTQMAEILDLSTGERRGLGVGLRPIPGAAAAPGSLATRVFSAPTGLVLVDPATGLRTPLIPIASTRKE
jgi:hypothetical protein